MSDYLAARHMARRAAEHIAAGQPPMAVQAFDFISREIALRGRFEGDELTALDEFLGLFGEELTSGTALDIGANIGNHTLFFARRFATVHAFEPASGTFALLAINAALAPNVTVHRLALADRDGEAILAARAGNLGESAIVDDQETPAAQGEVVAIRRLDDLDLGSHPVRFIKIDVEGHEPQVIRGGARLIAEHRPIIAFEQNRTAFRNGSSEAIELLVAAGYRICVMKKTAQGGGGLAVVNVLRKAIGGLVFSFELPDQIPPADYPMLVALAPEHLDRLGSG